MNRAILLVLALLIVVSAMEGKHKISSAGFLGAADDEKQTRPKKPDAIYLKNGNVLKGTIKESVAGDSTVTIILQDGSSETHKRSEILMISQDAPDLPQLDLNGNPITLSDESFHLEFQIGVSVPIGDFASKTSGGAAPGFIMGCNMILPVATFGDSKVGVQWITSVSGSFNGLNVDVPATSAVDAGIWSTAWTMTGFRLTSNLNGNQDFFLQAQAGGIFGSYPSLQIRTSAGQLDQQSTTGTAFAYKGGIGGIFNDKILVELNYMSGKPKYEITQTYQKQVAMATVVQESSMASLTIGLIF